jgi:hypothetical protein
MGRALGDTTTPLRSYKLERLQSFVVRRRGAGVFDMRYTAYFTSSWRRGCMDASESSLRNTSCLMM